MATIGQAFSPGLLQLMRDKIERQKDRNLKAAIADRQFRDNAKNRLLQKRLAERQTEANERNAERSARARMAGQTTGGKDPELADLEKELLRSRIRSTDSLAGKRDADKELTPFEKALLEAKARRTGGQADTEDATREGKAAEAEGKGRSAQAGAAVDEASVDADIAVRQGKPAAQAARTADTQAATALKKEKILTEEQMRGIKSDEAKQRIKESEARINQIAANIQNGKLRQALRREMFEAEKIRAGVTDSRHALKAIKDLIALQAKVDPVFGTRVIEENSEAAQQIQSMLEALVQMAQESGTQPDILRGMITNEQSHQLRQGGVLQEGQRVDDDANAKLIRGIIDAIPDKR